MISLYYKKPEINNRPFEDSVYAFATAVTQAVST